MSVQQELNAASPLVKSESAAAVAAAIVEPVKVDAPPKLEYTNPGRDSLAMLGAAVGGALLGVFLTLLVLAIVNRGTIRFNSQGQIRAMQDTIMAVDQNVGALSANLDTIVARLEGLQGQADVIPGLQTEISAAKTEIGAAMSQIGAAQETLQTQQAQLGEMNDSIAVLDVGRQKFDVFTGALSSALSEMSALDAPADAAAVEEAAPVEAASVEAAPVVMVTVAASADVAGDAVQVLYFADANANGVKDAEEASVVGMSLNLVDAEGAIVASAETDENGSVLFAGLAAGEYSLTSAEGDAIATLTVAEGAAQGQTVTVPVVE